MFLENVVVFFLLHLSKDFFLAALLSMQALSSPNWGRTHAPADMQSPNHWNAQEFP